jgi:hypothetical protein
MTQGLTFDEESSLKLKEDHTFDDLVTASYTSCEEENGGGSQFDLAPIWGAI